MSISFYTQLKEIQMVGLLTFSTSQAFSTGSTGKVRKAAIGLLKAMWQNIVRSDFFFKFYIFNKNISHFNLQNFRNRKKLFYLFWTTLMLSYGLRGFFFNVMRFICCARENYIDWWMFWHMPVYTLKFYQTNLIEQKSLITFVINYM